MNPMETATGRFHLASLPLGAKVTLSAFLALVGLGYLVGVANIYFKHSESDLKAGLGLDDLRRHYHGLDKPRKEGEPPPSPVAHMLVEVSPGGRMRKYLEKGGEAAVRSLITWLEQGSREADFTHIGIVQPGDPSPQHVIADNCVRCHNAAGGEKSDVPYAEDRDSLPTYALVSREAVPERAERLEPISTERLVHVTHAHILSMPVFVVIVAGFFFLTRQNSRVKTLLGPLPMLALCMDFASWWLARGLEPFVFLIGAAGGLFGSTLALQILCILGSLWLGKPAPERTSR